MERKKILTSKMNLDLRKRIVKCLVWSVALYASETWTISKTVMKRIKAFEMWIWRKMEKISWTAKVSNSEVLNRVKENSCIINTLNQRKCRWLGHVLRHDGLLRDILEGSWLGNVWEGERDYCWWATYARDMKQQGNELKTDVCDMSKWWVSVTC